MEKTDISMNRLTNRYVTDLSNNHLYTVPFIKQHFAPKRHTVKFSSKPLPINVELPFIIRKPSGEFMEDKISICSHISKAVPLICKNFGLKIGFDVIESGPLVRSSYHADEQARIIRR